MAKICRISKLLVAGVCVVVLSSTAYWKSHKKVYKKHLQKRQAEGPEFVSDNDEIPTEKDLKELLPGRLICQKSKKERFQPGDLTDELDIPDDIWNDELTSGRNKKTPIRISLSSLNPHRPVGCCPAGDPDGKVYRSGFGCCGDEVFNLVSHFCCRSKLRVFEKTIENRRFCDLPNGLSFCRESDLNMESKLPMTSQCEYNELMTPFLCRFACPNGTILKDDVTQTECLDIGEWDLQPTCCEGCPNSLRLDVWFLLEMSQDYGMANFALFMQFLKDTLSYMPISKDGVRTGITLFNRVVFFDVGVWYLNDHSSHHAINAAIDEIPIEGNGVNAGAALNWVADNAFTESKGDRADVENLAIVIVNGKPDDSIIEPARKLKDVSRVVAIAIGDKISNDDLSVIASSEEDIHRTESFETLKDLNKLLYKSACGETCDDESDL